MPGLFVGPEPPYRQIAADLRRRIKSGELGDNGRLPSSRDLMNEYGVASMTVHQAIKVLRDEGVVVSYPGRGVYVRDAEAAEATLSGDPSTLAEELREQLASLTDRIEAAESPEGVAPLRQGLTELRQQVGRIEANLIDLYGKIGQAYPHERQDPKRRGSTSPQDRKASNG